MSFPGISAVKSVCTKIAHKCSLLWDKIKDRLPPIKNVPAIRPGSLSKTARCKTAFMVFGSYFWRIAQKGAARWGAYAHAVNEAFSIPYTPAGWSFLLLTLINFLAKATHLRVNSVARLIAVITRNIEKMVERGPIFLSVGGVFLAVVGVSTAFGSPGLVWVFCSSCALSVIAYGIEKGVTINRKQRFLGENNIASTAKLSLARRVLNLSKDVGLRVAKKVGQFSAFNKVLYFFIGLLYQQMSWVPNPASDVTPIATSPWLYMLIGGPAALAGIIYVANRLKPTSTVTRRAVLGIDAVGAGVEHGSYMTLLVTRIIGSLTLNDQIFFWPFVGAMGVGGFFGMIGGVRHILKESARRSKALSDAQGDIETGGPRHVELEELESQPRQEQQDESADIALISEVPTNPEVSTDDSHLVVDVISDEAPARKNIFSRGWGAFRTALTSCFRRSKSGDKEGDSIELLQQTSHVAQDENLAGSTTENHSDGAVPLIPFQFQRLDESARSSSSISSIEDKTDEDGSPILTTPTAAASIARFGVNASPRRSRRESEDSGDRVDDFYTLRGDSQSATR